jgi:hypothetical protein
MCQLLTRQVWGRLCRGLIRIKRDPKRVRQGAGVKRNPDYKGACCFELRVNHRVAFIVSKPTSHRDQFFSKVRCADPYLDSRRHGVAPKPRQSPLRDLPVANGGTGEPNVIKSKPNVARIQG